MSKNKVLAPVKLTESQDSWIEDESFRTGNSKTVIIRALIQEKLDKAKKAKKCTTTNST